MKKFYFIKGIEKMIDPIDVGTIHFMQSYSKFLPKSIQNKMITKSAEKNPYMGFVVEPYSFFLSYEIKDVKWAQSLLPDKFKLVKTSIFSDDEPKYYCIFGSFNVHSSAFWGTRMEFYIIAENQETGLLSWVIIDYDTNTVSHDKANGLVEPNTSDCILTTNYHGNVIIDIKNKRKKRDLILSSNISKGTSKKLSQRLWLEGNLSIAYGKELSENEGDVFAVMFQPEEVEQALEIPVQDVLIEKNNWFPGLFENTPSQVVCFPYAQHFLSDSPGSVSIIENEYELISKVNQLNFDAFSKYSSKPIKKGVMISQAVTMVVILVLIVLLILK